MPIGFQVTVNPENNKFKVKRVNTGMGAKDGDNTFYINVLEDIDKLPSGVVVGAFNRTHPHNPVKKFRSLQDAREQGYEALRIMASSPDEKQEAPVAEGTEKPKRSRKKKEGEGSTEPRGPRLTQTQPKPAGEQKPAREGTKIAQMIDLLAAGTFASDLKQKLQRKGRALSGRIYRVHGYGIHSELRPRTEGGVPEVFYNLVYPEGMTSPLAHTKPEEKPAKAEKAEGEEGKAESGEAKPKRTRKAKAETATAGSTAEGDGAAAVSE